MRRFGIRIIGAVVILAIVGVISLFTVSGNEAGRFNDRLVDIATRSDERFTPLVAQCAAYHSGVDVDIDSLRQAQETLRQGIDADVAQMRSLSIPDCDACRGFYDAVLAYLEHSGRFADGYVEAIDYMDGHNPGEESDLTMVDSMLTPFDEEDQRLFAVVAERQKDVAKKYGYDLE